MRMLENKKFRASVEESLHENLAITIARIAQVIEDFLFDLSSDQGMKIDASFPGGKEAASALRLDLKKRYDDSTAEQKNIMDALLFFIELYEERLAFYGKLKLCQDCVFSFKVNYSGCQTRCVIPVNVATGESPLAEDFRFEKEEVVRLKYALPDGVSGVCGPLGYHFSPKDKDKPGVR